MEYNQKALSYLMKTVINYGGTNYHVAMLIFQLFPLLYRTTLVNRKVVWYKKEETAWVSLKKPEFEINIFRNHLSNYVGHARNSLKMPDDWDPDYENKYKMFLNDMTKMLKIENNIHSRSFMLEVLKELAELYYDKDG